MNPYAFSGKSSCFLKSLIANYSDIHYREVYSKVKDIDVNMSTITLYDGRKFNVILQEIT